jgi:hypothetical protein
VEGAGQKEVSCAGQRAPARAARAAMGGVVDGAWQQKCSKDWTDSDEYLGETMRCGLKREDVLVASTSMLVAARGEGRAA